MNLNGSRMRTHDIPCEYLLASQIHQIQQFLDPPYPGLIETQFPHRQMLPSSKCVTNSKKFTTLTKPTSIPTCIRFRQKITQTILRLNLIYKCLIGIWVIKGFIDWLNIVDTFFEYMKVKSLS